MAEIDRGRVGPPGLPGKDGASGLTPHIGDNGNWHIGTQDLGVKAQGLKGEKGDIGATGARGLAGTNGIDGSTPVIGENGHWWIGSTDTGVSAQGPKGDRGDIGETGPQGAKGDKGDTGAQGIQGIQGIPGKDAVVKVDGVSIGLDNEGRLKIVSIDGNRT